MKPQKSNIGSIIATIFFVTIIAASISFIWKSDNTQNWIDKTFNGEDLTDFPTPTPTPSDFGLDFGNNGEASESSSAADTHMIIRADGDYMPTEAQAEAAKNSIR